MLQKPLFHHWQILVLVGMLLRYVLTFCRKQICGQGQMKSRYRLHVQIKCGFHWVKNIVGKGENAGYQHFLLSSQGFEKLYILGSLQLGTNWLTVGLPFTFNILVFHDYFMVISFKPF